MWTAINNFDCAYQVSTLQMSLPYMSLIDIYGNQHVHIAPEAFSVSKVEFADQLEF